jgi:glucose-1-phosphate thymidylyltransferase
MRGIVLAGGTGSRLWPITQAVGKQLLPVYDKPLIFYSISTLMLAGIREVLVVTTQRELDRFQSLLGDGEHLGVSFRYTVQAEPKGIAEALLLGKGYVGNADFALVLGDNIFHGSGLRALLTSVVKSKANTIFAHRVSNPSEYGVAELSSDGSILSLEEKPKSPKSDFAVPGLYFYRNEILELAEQLQPSSRGELEITDLNREIFLLGELDCRVLPRGSSWFDAGTPDALLEASSYVQSLQRREGRKICCLEEIALEMGFMSPTHVLQAADRYGDSPYAAYIRSLVRPREGDPGHGD